MADGPSLTPERLSELLSRLDEVMADAARLRNEVDRQLKELRRREQPRPAADRRRPRKTR
jgi:hypothetical protein